MLGLISDFSRNSANWLSHEHCTRQDMILFPVSLRRNFTLIGIKGVGALWKQQPPRVSESMPSDLPELLGTLPRRGYKSSV